MDNMIHLFLLCSSSLSLHPPLLSALNMSISPRKSKHMLLQTDTATHEQTSCIFSISFAINEPTRGIMKNQPRSKFHAHGTVDTSTETVARSRRSKRNLKMNEKRGPSSEVLDRYSRGDNSTRSSTHRKTTSQQYPSRRVCQKPIRAFLCYTLRLPPKYEKKNATREIIRSSSMSDTPVMHEAPRAESRDLATLSLTARRVEEEHIAKTKAEFRGGEESIKTPGKA
jgi:hypothetical protein